MKRLIFAFTLVGVLFAMLSGCRKQTGTETVAGAELTVGDRGTLTGIYEPTPLALPDGFTLADTAQIGTDPEKGEILVLAQRGKEIEAEDGTVAYLADLCLISYDENGAKLREVPLEDAHNSGPRVAAVSPERVWAFCDLTQAGSGRLLEWDASSGKLLSQTETQNIKGWAGQTSPRKLITDAKGNLWLSDPAKVVVISPERVWINQFKLNASDLAALPDGSVWAVSNLSSGRGIARLDPETGRYEDAITLWDKAINAAPGGPEDGYRFYYNGENGICGVRTDEDGKPVSEELMTFVNSNVNYNASLVPSEDTIQLTAALSEDVFVMTDWSRGSDGRFRFLPVLYHKGEDLDLSGLLFGGTPQSGAGSGGGRYTDADVSDSLVTIKDSSGKEYTKDEFKTLPAGEYTVNIKGGVGNYYKYTYCYGVDISYKVTIKGGSSEVTVWGDTNCDGTVELADAILVMQCLANPDKYGEGGSYEKALTAQGRINADVDKSTVGLTSNDALRIQEFLLKKRTTLVPE